MAAEFVRLGWTLKREFRADGDDEPYEYLASHLPVHPAEPLIGRPLLDRPQPHGVLSCVLEAGRYPTDRQTKIPQRTPQARIEASPDRAWPLLF